VPVPAWAKRVVDEWTDAASINTGALFRRVGRLGKIWGANLTPKAIWHVVKAAAKRGNIKNLAPHDLRRTCARLCHLAGGELEQIQLLLGHASVQTTEHYLGCKQKLRHAVNDNLAWRTSLTEKSRPRSGLLARIAEQRPSAGAQLTE
jgi:integrase